MPTRKSERNQAAAIALCFSVLLAWVPGAHGAPIGAPVLNVEAPLRIIAFGSSSTKGYGATKPSASYPAQLQALLANTLPNGRKVEVINRGISGEDADDMMRRLKDDVIARRPDVVIWQTGSNDPVRHVPLARFERLTRAGIEQMRAAGIDVILMESQWCPKLEMISDAMDYREAVRRIGRDMNVEVIRRADLMHDWIREGMLTQQQMLSPDGMHMTDAGYQLLARSTARKVMQLDDFRPVAQRTSTAIR